MARTFVVPLVLILEQGWVRKSSRKIGALVGRPESGRDTDILVSSPIIQVGKLRSRRDKTCTNLPTKRQNLSGLPPVQYFPQ